LARSASASTNSSCSFSGTVDRLIRRDLAVVDERAPERSLATVAGSASSSTIAGVVAAKLEGEVLEVGRGGRGAAFPVATEPVKLTAHRGVVRHPAAEVVFRR